MRRNRIIKITSVIMIPIISIISFLWFTPQIFSHDEMIYTSLDTVDSYNMIVLFGARVYSNGNLSPVVRQRADASCLLFQKRKVPVLVSGNGKHEVDSISKYLISKNIPSEFIRKDYSGCDTHDTMLTLEKDGFRKIIAVSQGFHLYRIIDMADDHGLDVSGFAAEKVLPHEEKIPLSDKLIVRVQRRFRNAALFWLYRMKLYDSVSALSN